MYIHQSITIGSETDNNNDDNDDDDDDDDDDFTPTKNHKPT
jgi:hypothetical protein